VISTTSGWLYTGISVVSFLISDEALL